MNNAMEYIESHLASDISYDKAAQIACCSTYHFQRMFSFVINVPSADPAVQCKKAWSRICEWFATSEYEHACGPDLEKGFDIGDVDAGNINFIYEVWIPIIKRNN